MQSQQKMFVYVFLVSATCDVRLVGCAGYGPGPVMGQGVLDTMEHWQLRCASPSILVPVHQVSSLGAALLHQAYYRPPHNTLSI